MEIIKIFYSHFFVQTFTLTSHTVQVTVKSKLNIIRVSSFCSFLAPIYGLQITFFLKIEISLACINSNWKVFKSNKFRGNFPSNTVEIQFKLQYGLENNKLITIKSLNKRNLSLFQV
jgi:hypothetical protein